LAAISGPPVNDFFSEIFAEQAIGRGGDRSLGEFRPKKGNN